MQQSQLTLIEIRAQHMLAFRVGKTLPLPPSLRRPFVSGKLCEARKFIKGDIFRSLFFRKLQDARQIQRRLCVQARDAADERQLRHLNASEPQQQAQLEAFLQLLLEQNRHLNLTGKHD